MHAEVDSDPWLTTADVEARVQVGRKLIYRAIRRGKLRAAQIDGRGDYRFRRSWVDGWVESCAEPVRVK